MTIAAGNASNRIHTHFPIDFTLGLAILVLTIFAALVLNLRVGKAQEWITHTREVVERLERVDRQFSATELRARDYAVTGNSEAKLHYYEMRLQVEQGLEALSGLLEGNPEQVAGIKNLQTIAAKAFKQRQEMLSDNSGPLSIERLRAFVESADVSQTASEWRQGVENISGTERALLNERTKIHRDQAALDLFAVLSGCAISCGLLFLSGIRRQRAIVELDDSREDLACRQIELQASETRFRETFDMAPIGIAHVDLDGTLMLLNSKYHEILGYAPGELAAVTFQAITDPEDLELDLANVNMLLRGEAKTYTMDKRYIRKDGSRVWVTLTVSLVRDDDGQPSYFIAAANDISERISTENQLKKLKEGLETHLQRREAELTLITGVLPAGVLYIDVERRYKFCNPIYASWLGKPVEEIVGRPVREIVGENYYRSVEPHMNRAFAGERTSYEARLTYWDKKRDIHVEFVPDVCDGKVRGCVVMISDISALISAQEQLLAAKAAADEANSAKSIFLASVSHEIRTPLGVMLGYADLMSVKGTTPDVRDAAEIISRNGQNLLALLNDILDLSKVEAGRLEIDRKSLQVGPVIADVVGLMQLKAHERGLALKTQIAGPVPRYIETDEVRFRQILTNIIGNALKFTERGSITVTLKPAVELPTLLEVLVEDTGPGIPSEYHQRIFKPFTQAEQYITRKFGGTGLGLSLSRELARSLGGDVLLVRSVPGQGSLFSIRVAMGHVENSYGILCDEDVVMRARRSQNSTSAGRLIGAKILLVEDFEDMQTMMRSILCHQGADVDVAGNGQEGAERAIAGGYDLVLMDIQMPIMDGYQAIAKLRDLHYERPVIALTAHAMKGEAEHCLRAGFTDYLAKPVDRTALIAKVEQYRSAAKPLDRLLAN